MTFPGHLKGRLDWDAEPLAAELSEMEQHLQDGCRQLHGKFTQDDVRTCQAALEQVENSETAARSAAAAHAAPGAIGAEYTAARRQVQLEGERATTKRTLLFLLRTGDKNAAEELLQASLAQDLLSQESKVELAARVSSMPVAQAPLAPRNSNTARSQTGGKKRAAAVSAAGQCRLPFAKVSRGGSTGSAGSSRLTSTQRHHHAAPASHTCMCRRCGCIFAVVNHTCPLCGSASLATGAVAAGALVRAFRPRNPWEAAAVAHAVRPESCHEDGNTVTLLDSP